MDADHVRELYGDAGTVRLLLEEGADANAQNDDGGTALMYATDDLEKTRLCDMALIRISARVRVRPLFLLRSAQPELTR